MQLDEGPTVELDDDGAPVFLASAIAGDTFADLAFYPDDALLFIKIPLEVKRDSDKAKNIFCFFENFEAGKRSVREWQHRFPVYPCRFERVRFGNMNSPEDIFA